MMLAEVISKYFKINCFETCPDSVNLNFISKYIEKDSNRCRHIIGVVEKMKETIHKIDGLDEETRNKLICIAFLHDVGYSEQLIKSGFHPLDGGIFAIEKGFDEVIIKAILFHSTAASEALLIGGEVAEVYSKLAGTITEEDKFYIDLITYCDMHTNGAGKHVELRERIDDILERYEPESITAMNIKNNTQYFYEVKERIDKMLI